MIWLHRIASMKLAIGLMIVLAVAMAAATIVESFQGTAAAHTAVYGTWWFYGLLGLLGVNVTASILEHWPWGRRRIGFLLTHTSLVLILVGAAVTWQFGIDGQIAIWEGESENSYVLRPDSPGDPEVTATLPFRIRLESFEIDYYQGTRRPAMFRSRVVVEDPASGKEVPAVIQMNDGLSFGGYNFYQSSYQQTPERDMTVLSVSKDPGMWIAFAGYTLLLIGMCTVLGTRMAQARAMARNSSNSGLRIIPKAAATFAIGALLAAVPSSASAGVVDGETIDRLRRLPIQYDGRLQPLDTVAREAVWNVTGKRTWQGIDETALVLDWAFDPPRWGSEKVVKLGGKGIQEAIGYPPGTKYASFNDLVRNQTLMRLMGEARAAAGSDEKLPPLYDAVLDLQGRLDWMYAFFQRSAFRSIPSEDPIGAWSAPAHVHEPGDLVALMEARPAGWPEPKAMEREILYNSARPTRLAWVTLLISMALSMWAWQSDRRWIDRLSLVALVVGFAVMTWGIGIRWQIADRIPASNMYESLLFLGWGVGLFALIAYGVLKNRLVVFNAAAMSALTMMLTDLLPIDGFIHPVAPVLAGTAWLAIHVPIIMVAYSVLALGVFFAHLQIGIGIFRPTNRELAARMADLLYWYTFVGSILLIAGILTGSVWASSSWGRYWGWDPKEVWSLVAFIAYMAILHGRFARYIGSFWTAALSIVAFWTVLMTYVGVNFVLAAGLHSYGFGSSSVVNWFAAVALVEVVFIAAGWLAYRKARTADGVPIPV